MRILSSRKGHTLHNILLIVTDFSFPVPKSLADTSNNLPIVLTQPIVISAGETVVLDLNGKTITGPSVAKDADGNVSKCNFHLSY